MAKELYFPLESGGQYLSKKTKEIYFPLLTNGQYLSKKVVKAYCSVNGVSKLFWDGGVEPEYNYHQRPTSFFSPNVAYNLNKLDMRTTLETALDTCAYLSVNNPTILAVVEKFQAEIENIWTYVTSRLTNEDTLDMNLYLANMGYPTISLYFSKTTTTNVQISTPVTGRPKPSSSTEAVSPVSLRYALSNTLSPSSKRIEIEYDVSNDRFSYSYYSTTWSISIIGGYTFYFENGTNPQNYQVLNFIANNLGASQDATPIDPNEDFFMKIDCANGRVIEGANSSGDNSNNLIVDDTYNYYCIAYQKDTSQVEKTTNGLEIKKSYITLPPPFLNKGLGDYIIKMGAIDLDSAWNSGNGGWLLYIASAGFGIWYNPSPTYRPIGWYVRDGSTFATISTNGNIFTNALIQLHFTGNTTFSLYVNGSSVASNLPCSTLFGTGVGVCYMGRYQYSMNMTVEKVAISRSREIVIHI